VQRVRQRQRALGVTESFEWVEEVSPAVRVPVAESGLAVSSHPLLLLDRAHPVEEPEGVSIRTVGPDDDVALFSAVAQIGFGHPGTAVGSAGIEDVRRLAAERPAGLTAFERDRLRSGRTVMAAAFLHGEPVAVGSHQPLAGVSEIVGVATLPAFRRSGIAAAVTGFLVRDAIDRGVETVFLSAGDEEIARVYERIGFLRLATACIAEPPEGS
jgi:ribosomal protein S18 acetylase RimI-like enzyme